MNIEFIEKKDGRIAPFDTEKIKNGIFRAVKEAGGNDKEKSDTIALKVIASLEEKANGSNKVKWNDVLDEIENALIKGGHDKTARAFILYRYRDSMLRNPADTNKDNSLMKTYLDKSDWAVKENSNMGYSLQGLNFNLSSKVTQNYWLTDVYPADISKLHVDGDIHIHDLGILGPYCLGHDLATLLFQGFNGVPGKISSGPAKHLRTALGQAVNFIFTLQGEAAGAQAFSNFDTLLAPFIKKDNLTKKQVTQALQEFLYGMNVSTRVGFQCPFSNVTLDVICPTKLKNTPAGIGGKIMDFTYGECQKEMNLFNEVFCELMIKGDFQGRLFSFPIPTYNIHKNFEWDNPRYDKIWDMTSKYGIPYFANYVNSDMSPDQATSMCLDGDEQILIKEKNKIKNTTMKKLLEKKLGHEKYGWKKQNKNIKVLSLNKNKNIEWKPIINSLKLSAKKTETIKLRNGIKTTLTCDHPCLIYKDEKIIEIPAKNVKKDDLFLVMNGGKNILNKKIQKIENFDLDKDLAFLLGFFTADGNYLFEHKSNKCTGLQFTFNALEKNSLQRIRDIVKQKFGYVLKEKKDPRYNTYYTYMYNTLIGNILNNSGFIKYGSLPNILFNSPKEIIESFLEGFFEGDGWKKRKTIHINDKILIQDLSLLYHLIGKPTYLRFRKNSQVLRIAHTNSTKLPLFKMVTPKSLLKKGIYLSKVVEIKLHKKQQAVYDIEVKQNHNFIHSNGIISNNCCRLRIDRTQLQHRGGGLFGSSPNTGSIGVVTINLPRIGYLSKNEEEFFEKLNTLMEAAKESLIIKTELVEKFTNNGLYPYTKVYLKGIKESTGKYWSNHFLTIGLIGMNETSVNFINKDITTPEGNKFAIKVLSYMQQRMIQYQKNTGYLFNLEATPGEGTTRRMAHADKKRYPSIIVANEPKVKASGVAPYYTNSSQLPVDANIDLFTALKLQDPLQTKYSGGTVFHIFLGEKSPSPEAVKQLIKRICTNYKMPYISLTPTFSICPIHGYISGEHEYCPKCLEEGEK